MKPIPMLDLKGEYEYMKRDIDAALQRCLDHQQWIFGPEIAEFEKAVGDYIGVKHAVGVSSGTEALVLSLRALAIKRTGEEYFGRRDEIITTPFTFTATGDAILRSGATPVFVDIDPRTYNVDLGRVREYLAGSRGKDTRVVGLLPVHLYGQPNPMDEISALAKEYGLFVVEDVAQAFGAMWKEKKVGSFGEAGAFSFFPSKNLGGFGDAGMITTDDDETAALVRMLLKHGGRDKYNVDHVGYNARLDTLQAAILLAKMRYIDEFTEGRRRVAELYTRDLATVEDLVLPVGSSGDNGGSASSSIPGGSFHVFHQYTVRTSRRDELQSYLKEKGIATMVYYPYPLHLMKVFQGKMKTDHDLSHAEQAAREVLSLPIEPLQQESDTRSVAEAIRGFFHRS